MDATTSNKSLTTPCRECGISAACCCCRVDAAMTMTTSRPTTAQQQQRVCFSITEPTSLLEWTAAYCIGGLGAVHQYVTMLAFADATKRSATVRATYSDDDVQQLVAGVIWNDFPSGDGVDGVRYARETLVPITGSAAPYLSDARFRWQPSRETRWALAFVYKRMPALLANVFGVGDEARRAAERMLEFRAAQERTHFHFMLTRRDEPMDDVRSRAAAAAREWYRRALLEQNVFVLGHVLHMVEDSYSAAHTKRVPPDGDLAEVYFFGAQTDRSHSSLESYAAVSRPGGEPEQRVRWCVAAVSDIIARFAADRSALWQKFPAGKPTAAVTATATSAEAAQEYLRLSDGAVDSFYNTLLQVTFHRAEK